MNQVLLFLPLLAPAAPQDFNNDGYADLAIGAPGETINGQSQAGSVTVLYGGPGGLTSSGAEWWHQDVPGVEGVAEVTDNFGQALAWGNFNGDAYDDLAIGVPGEDVDDFLLAGIVQILYGSPSGLTATGDQLLRLDDPGMAGDLQHQMSYGWALAAGNFNGAAGSGYDDLAIGMPGATVNGQIDAGMVHVMFGSPGGLSTAGDFVINQAQVGAGQLAGNGEKFGWSLAAGQFNFDGYADLAIGSPSESVGGSVKSGMVQVLYGSYWGPQPESGQAWHQDAPGVLDLAEGWDEFGTALATGDFDGDSFDDLAITVPSEDLPDGTINGGAVCVLFGSAAGLSATGDELLYQGNGLEGMPEAGDRSGAAVIAGDFNGDGRADLAVGSPYEGVGNVAAAGAVHLVYGHDAGLWAGAENNLLPGTGSDVGENDRFGAALGTGDFDGDGLADLAIGATGEDVGGVQQCGEVEVFYGVPGSGGHNVWHRSPLLAIAAFGAAFAR